MLCYVVVSLSSDLVECIKIDGRTSLQTSHGKRLQPLVVKITYDVANLKVSWPEARAV